ncbi:PREDICTED: acylsugar acyltransferase 3-like [Nicotiana attenuata]|uniref:Acylsugar acyltransferase 3 n=1 Tax=Nicotiana attenuata TaxID=49451 RepID=A0A314L8Y1_NICAT|nr:PREDICTED: acylsugar acyltransferase 3-like [Nicotiana attenuata]OIT37557.1 acylsugar acyltransferase 3 [Nicotiana attenuata]
MAISRLVSLSQKIIKPSSPTPFSHRIHNLSLMDQMGTHSYIPFSFFYPKQDTASSLEPTKVSQILEKSLSKVLTAYYPFAGRVRDNSFVECNDMGVDLSQVRIDCPMSSIFNHPRTDIDKLIFPKDPWNLSTGSLIVAQLNHFECGGIILSACISHKVVDGYSMTNFLRDWALVARDSEAKPSPLFNGASVFQPANYSAPPQVADPSRKQNASKRYHFSASKLKALKARSQIPPTTVEAVTALLCKCANTPTFKPSLLIQAVNLQGTNNDALVPAGLVGNAILPYVASAANEEDLKWQRLIGELRERKEKVHDMLKDIKSEDILFSRVSELATQINERTSSNDFSIYRFSSLRKFPFHDINFGWGRPTRVDAATFPVNMFLLLDNQNGDGVEVLVNLEEGEMSVFESNEELLQFASPSSGL